ncbi:sensor histidine kinase [Actinacidiphila acidipaludis]|uniref:histidine kinase n=1 Tax=Actinacidiphila acidipaludis TaxID=2873382 RepID=A0ABS7Q6R4_9ACTN|nr:HAMP domain-containing sensor histidine kinase [Streptomyces acidipaludis]MBY8878833.1 HAMP domain-containing histidine kinase [Streptomyces acidipaludis]
MGVRLRTTLTATAAVAVALCLASVALFAALDASLAASTKATALQDAKARAAEQLRAAGGAPPPGSGLPGPPALVAGESGGGQGGTQDRPDPGESVVTTEGANGQLVVTQVVATRQGAVTVRGTASLAPARAAMNTLTDVLVPGVPALLALVALLTWLAVGRVLRPVSAIRAKVAEITAHGLHERVPEPDTRDEIAALARTVNATLDRLRTAVDAHRQFVADAAHELRSPMAVLRTRLELAGPAEKALAAEALDDVARLQSLTSDLLLLARLDAHEPLRAREVDLAQVVAEEAARPRPRPDVAVALHLDPDVTVHGSPEHLRRLVANLVDNAVRHAATSVTVSLAAGHDRGGRQAVLEVADDGPGIPPEHRRTVFDRFTRLDHARPRDTGGAGLGLPIARDIATEHGGTLTVVPHDHGGARLRAVLPLPGRPALVPA